MSPSTSYENLEAVARNLLEGLNVLLNSEQVKCSIFLDGPVIEALYNVAKPLMFGKIQNAIRNGVLEFLGGGYYDPMLPLFPEDLQTMQLELHRADDAAGVASRLLEEGAWRRTAGIFQFLAGVGAGHGRCSGAFPF